MFRNKRGVFRGGPVISDEGFSVEFRSETSIIYTDDFGIVYVSGEQGSPIDIWALFKNQPMYISCVGGEIIKDEKRKELIIDRIVAAAQFKGIMLQMIDA